MLIGVGGELAARPSAVSPAVSHPVHPVHPSHPAHPEHPVAHTAHPAHPASVSHPVHPAASSGKSDTYTVHSGDTLSGIASQHHLSLSALEKDNPQIKNPNLIHSGESVNLPQDTVSLSPHAQGLKGETHPASTNADTYTVHSGDTLSGIASQHHLSLSALEKDNPQIKNLNLILPGQILHLGSGINSAPSPSPGLLNHSGVEAHPGTGGWARPIPNASAGSQPQYDLIGFFVARPDTAAMYV